VESYRHGEADHGHEVVAEAVDVLAVQVIESIHQIGHDVDKEIALGCGHYLWLSWKIWDDTLTKIKHNHESTAYWDNQYGSPI
jgi:hypothetical protein